jgi:hypothetical protein
VTVSGNYSTPVQVNGFTCRNCTDVDYAKKHIDPDHPKAGPYGVNAANDPSLADKPVMFVGSLAALNSPNQPARRSRQWAPAPISIFRPDLKKFRFFCPGSPISGPQENGLSA